MDYNYCTGMFPPSSLLILHPIPHLTWSLTYIETEQTGFLEI